MIVFCCDERRGQRLRVPGVQVNGIDYIEVLDHDAPAGQPRQRILRVHFFNASHLAELTTDNFLIDGGERIARAFITDIAAGDRPEILLLTADQRGDFSIYALRIVDPDSDLEAPPAGFDPVLSATEFSFKVECPTPFDCRPSRVCPPARSSQPSIDYVAKDYASFRQLMLDRISLLSPQWQERNAADLGVALVELLAYVGDYLSYQQDAIATEAYLGTARRRVSVRRLARMVDYAMHDGCNARLLAQIQISTARVVVKAGTSLLTTVPGVPVALAPNTSDYSRVFAARPEVFETMHEITLFQENETMPFYTWGDRDCCVPQGALSATLAGPHPNLQTGDLVILRENLGPRTGVPADADLKHRHAVRLTAVIPGFDPLGTVADPSTPVPVTEIQWAQEDALPFALCLSSVTPGGVFVPDVSVALGNIVLCDHGRTITEDLGAPPQPNPALQTVATDGDCHCCSTPSEQGRARFQPSLQRQPLTQYATIAKTSGGRRMAFDPSAPAVAAFQYDAASALPAISLADDNDGAWFPQRDLLSSDSFAEEFVAEVDEQGTATLRFGDNEYGSAPAAGVNLTATYRIGNGTAGNVGAEALGHLVATDPALRDAVTAVSNPMPAQGGVDPESIDHVRQSAPYAFRVQERAVTPADYAAITKRHPEVQRAAATARWAGSWITMFIAVDRLGGRPVDAAFRDTILAFLEPYRMAGHDIEVDGPRFVSLELEMHICIDPDYFRSDVLAALLSVFSSGVLPDGRKGFFHPDNFTFGQPVYLSAILSVAQAVPGVRFVDCTNFQRQGIDSIQGIDSGVLLMDRLEIARLDNDPNFSERGVLTFDLDGGK